MITAPPDRRSVTIPPTASTGISATNIITQSHSPRPSPSHLLHSQKQHKAPVGLIVGVGIAIIAALLGLFFVRWLFVRRKRRREAFSGPGRTFGSGVVAMGGKGAAVGTTTKEGAGGMPMPMPAPAPMQATDKDAVELASYPPPTLPPSSVPPSSTAPPSLPSTHTQSASWSTPFSSASPASGVAVGEPGPNSTPAARQAYLAAELRAAQALLERAASGRHNLGDKSIDVKATKARIRELEARQGSAWALGLE